MFAFFILFVHDFNIVLVFISFYINSFSFLFSLSLGFLSSSHSRFRERSPNHFHSSFSFVYENNTGPFVEECMHNITQVQFVLTIMVIN